MTEFSLDLLLKAIKLARSTYYYHLKQLDKTDKDQELKAEIQSIFIEHKGNYAYRVEKPRGRVPESGECHPKKVKRIPIEGGKRERRKTEIVQELMTEFSLDILLKAIKLARSTYYYHLKQLDKPDKDQELKAEIQSIFIEHKGNYGYRRIYLELRNRGYLVNHKRVQGLMKVLNLQAKMRQKRK
ncbi:transposase InsK for insertion sequence [Streptococcus pneumoniae]|nr:transposase InsK for insertion sequence [Streptococcus pneumoniae]